MFTSLLKWINFYFLQLVQPDFLVTVCVLVHEVFTLIHFTKKQHTQGCTEANETFTVILLHKEAPSLLNSSEQVCCWTENYETTAQRTRKPVGQSNLPNDDMGKSTMPNVDMGKSNVPTCQMLTWENQTCQHAKCWHGKHAKCWHPFANIKQANTNIPVGNSNTISLLSFSQGICADLWNLDFQRTLVVTPLPQWDFNCSEFCCFFLYASFLLLLVFSLRQLFVSTFIQSQQQRFKTHFGSFLNGAPTYLCSFFLST